MLDDRDVSGGCTQYPESIKYFGSLIVSPIVGLVFAGGLIFFCVATGAAPRNAPVST